MPSIFDLIGNNRSIYLFDTVNQFSAQSIIKDLMKMNQESDEPISMFINSGGGSVVHMFAILDVMNAIKSPVNTFVLGQAASAASLIAANGDERFISPNSEMMIHEAACTMVFDTRDKDSFKALEEIEALNERVNMLYSQVTNKSQEEIKALLSAKEDITLNAKESIAFGLVDEIMTEDQLSKIKLSESIKLSEAFSLEDGENELKRVHLLKVCELKDRGISITKEMLKGAKANFDANIRGIDIALDCNTHDNDEGEKPAAAWLKSLDLSEDGEHLRGMVSLTDTGKKLTKGKEFKYLSVELSPLYEDENGKMHSNVLLGGTFTNRPAVKGLDPIKLSETKNKIDMELTKEEISSIESVKTEMNLEIKDIHSTMLSMKQENATLSSEKAELTANLVKLEAEATESKNALLKLSQEKIDAEKLSAVESLIEKGIIINAQKDKVLNLFSSQSAINEFYKDVPASVTVEPKGADMEDVTFDSKLIELSKQTGQSIEDLKKYGKKQ